MMDSDRYVESLWEHFTFPPGAFMNKAKRHASRLKRMYYDVLEEMGTLSDEDLEDSFGLFLSSYFLDDAFDKSDRPYALAIGLHLYSEYFHKIGEKHPEKLDTLREYYRLQMMYQSAEKDHENERGYDLSYIADPDSYHMKQIILLFPLELSENENREKVFRMFIHYYCCILLTDDIVDAEEDYESGTLTPLTYGCKSEKDLPASRSRCYELFSSHRKAATSYSDVCPKGMVEALISFDKTVRGLIDADAKGPN